MKLIFVSVVKLYQLVVSPFLGKSCRFHPSCSQYAIDAITTYGILKGLYLTTIRLLKCNPLSLGGYDPIVKDDEQKY